MSKRIIESIKQIYRPLRRKYVEIVTKIKNERFERRIRKKLTNDNFSIICSNCIGGIIYNRLNKQFLSPTINLWMWQYDFIKFAKNLRYYIDCELEFIKSDEDFPVGKLDDILIFFNHSNSEEEARNDWNRRKSRINYDNLYIIMSERDGISKDDIKSLASAKCKNKIVLSANHYDDIDFVYQIKPDLKTFNPDSFISRDDYQMRTFEKQWDFVSFLNS